MPNPLDPDQDLVVGQFGFRAQDPLGDDLADLVVNRVQEFGEEIQKPFADLGEILDQASAVQGEPPLSPEAKQHMLSQSFDALVPSAKLGGIALTFGSKAFKSFNQGKLNDAVTRLAKGEDPNAVRMDTGFFMGPDGAPRFEFSDRNTKMLDLPKTSLGKSLDKVVDHPILYDEYPDLKNVKVVKLNVPEGSTLRGRFNAKFDKDGNVTGGTIEVNPRYDKEEQLSTILHEMQHWIQVREGIAEGSSSKLFAGIRDNMERLGINADRMDNTFDLAKRIAKSPDRADDIVVEFMQNNPGRPINAEAIQQVMDGKANLKDILVARNRANNRFQMAQSLSMQDDGLNYFRTIGEIEARDVQRRFRDVNNITPREALEDTPALARTPNRDSELIDIRTKGKKNISMDDIRTVKVPGKKDPSDFVVDSSF